MHDSSHSSRRALRQSRFAVRIVTAWVLAALNLSGCATIGPAVPKLSSDIGDRMSEMRSLHELALRRMFDGERRRVDAFMDQRWTPTFLRNYIGVTNIIPTITARRTISEDREVAVSMALREYLADTTEAPAAAYAVVHAVEAARTTEPATVRRELDRYVEERQLEAASDHILALLGTDDPAKELLEWARQAQIRIQAERDELHAPIDEAEARVLSDLGAAYDELMAAQGALTSRVQAAAKVKEIQDDALRGLGVKQSFDEARKAALSIGAGVGNALDHLEALERAGRLQDTSLGRILRESLNPTGTPVDSITSQGGK